MINRKVSKIIGPAAGIMGFLMVMGTVSMPAYAEENKCSVEYNYNEAALSKEAINDNNVLEQNGVKVTVKKIDATKNKMKVTMEVTTNKELDDESEDGFHTRISMNGISNERRSRSRSSKGKYKLEQEIENQDGFPEKGTVRIDVVNGQLELNGCLKIPVDFTSDFNNVFTKEIHSKVNGADAEIDRLESNSIDTSIVLSQVDNGTMSIHQDLFDKNIKFMVDVDGMIYSAHLRGNVDSSDDKIYTGYEVEGLTYDKVKNAKSIKIKQVMNSMSQDERNEFYRTNRDDSDKGLITKDNVKLPEKISFNDNTEGKINVVKENDKIKFYCSSDSDFKSMLMAVGAHGLYQSGENDYEPLNNKNVYKDTSTDNQYVVEFDNDNNDKQINVFIDKIISNIDKYSLGDEIKIK